MDRYYRYSKYLKGTFGCAVYKVSIDAGFSCPNKDGKLSKDGCIFCDNRAFSFNSRAPITKSIEKQIEEGIDFGRSRYAAKKFIIYFQAFTNTYAPLNVLKERYDIIRRYKDIVGISIGTRPDCVTDDIFDLIKIYTLDYNVCFEYGLQSIHDRTLTLINRNHTYNDFLKALEKTKQHGIQACCHIIIGLPDETKDQIIQTAKELARLKVDAVKIHPLHIVKDTTLAKLYKDNRYKPMDLKDFINLTVNFLEHLSPDTVIQRIGADCPKGMLMAPDWISDKQDILELIEKDMQEKNTYQGRLYA